MNGSIKQSIYLSINNQSINEALTTLNNCYKQNAITNSEKMFYHINTHSHKLTINP